MSTSPIVPRGTRRSGSGLTSIVVVLFIVAGVGYFLYNMVPNLFSAILPGSSHSGVKGEWVGLVTYQESMMSSMNQPAAIKLTFDSTDMTSIIPTYKMTGEMAVAGHTVPVTFQVDKAMTGHEIISLNGIVTESSNPGLKEGMVTGGVEDGKMKFELHAMAAGSTASIQGTNLKHGSDSDFESLKKQLK